MVLYNLNKIKKNLIILSGGKEAISGIKVAKKMGLYVIVCDGNKNAPGRKICDKFIHVNIYEPKSVIKKLVQFSKKRKIDGVLTIGTDAVNSVAGVAAHFHLPGVSKNASKLATNKLMMKKSLKKNKIPTTEFTEINSYDKLKRMVKKYRICVLKPNDSRGARGVLKLDLKSDLRWAYTYSKKFSKSNKLILEKWLDGDQLSAEAVVINGKLYLCGLADRNYSKLKQTLPFVIEDGGETPSNKSKKVGNKVSEIMDKIAKTWKIKNGILKGDLIFDGEKISIIEIAVRLSGGFFSTITIPLVYHINIIEIAIKLSLGIKMKPPPEKLKVYSYQANRFFFFRPGIVKEVRKINRKKIPKYVKYFELNVKKGIKIEKIENHTMRYGSVLTVGNSRSEAIARVKKIRDMNKIKINNEGFN